MKFTAISIAARRLSVGPIPLKKRTEKHQVHSPKREITIAIIDPIGKHAGFHYYVHGTAIGMAKNGLKVHTFVTRQTGAVEGSPYLSHICFESLYGQENKLKRAARYVIGIAKALAKAKGAKATHTYLHAFNHDLRETIAIWGARLIGTKTILTIHDIEAFGKKRSRITKLISRINLAGANKIVVQNDYSKNSLIATYPALANTEVNIIPHGNYCNEYPTPTQRNIARQKLSLPEQGFILLFFGNPRKEKGLDTLIAALSECDKKKHITLLVAGKMKLEDKLNLETKIRELHLQDNIELRSHHIDDKEAELMYSAANAVVIPYRTIYESGVAIMAQSLGRCIVVSDQPVLVEKVKNGQYGYIFKTGESSDLARKIADALHNTANLDLMGAKALEETKINRDWGKIGQMHKEMLT